jgi:hypothetical protein
MRLAALVLVACGTSRGAPPPITWSPPFEIARGGGEKGPWQQNESRFDYVDDPSVALMANGGAAVVWVDHRDKDVHFRMFGPTGKPWGPAVNVSNTPAVFSWLPRIVVDGSDVFVLWQEIVFSGGTHGGEAYFARSIDGGRTFEAPLDLSQSKNGDGKGRLDAKTWDNGSLDLVQAGDGTLHAAWTEYDGPLWVSRSLDRGASFSTPRQLGGTAEAPARAPTIATHVDTVAVAWTVGEDRSGDLRIAMSNDGGLNFTEPSLIARTPGYSDAPKLAIDRAGTIHLVYSESEGGWRERAAIYYTRSRAPQGDRARTFEPARRVSPIGAAFPSLVVEGRHVYASWEVLRDEERARGLALAYSLDGGDHFTAPIPVDGSTDPEGGINGSHQGKLMRKLAVRGGAIAIVNSALEHGDHSRVWLIRGRRR